MAARLNGAGGMVDDADESRLYDAQGKEVCSQIRRVYALLNHHRYIPSL